MRFCNEGENARQGFRRRLVQTPGVVASRENDLGCSLVLDKAELKLKPSEKILAALAKSRLLWERPDGHLMVEAIEQWQMMRSLALGFWYRWDPAPPDDWCEANKAWRTFVQLTLRNNRRGLDTELQVWNDCERNSASLPTYHPFFDWKNIKETFKPNPVPQWIDDFAVDACIEWMKGCKTDAPGIVWTESIAFGDRVAEKSGLPYFGAGKSSIINFRGPCAIASISAHGEGKELQHFSRNLIVSPPSSGKIWEQLLGRTHRHGQEADSVSCEILLYTPEQIASLQHALEDAQYLEHTYGNRQKLNFASRTKSLDMLVTVC